MMNIKFFAKIIANFFASLFAIASRPKKILR